MTSSKPQCGVAFGTAIGAGHICRCTRTARHTADGTYEQAHGCPCMNWWPQPGDLDRQQESIR